MSKHRRDSAISRSKTKQQMPDYLSLNGVYLWDGLCVGGLEAVGGLPEGGLPVGGLPMGGLLVGGPPMGGLPYLILSLILPRLECSNDLSLNNI